MNTVSKLLIFVLIQTVVNTCFAQYHFDTIPSPDAQAIDYSQLFEQNLLFVDRLGNLVLPMSDTSLVLKKYDYSGWFTPDSADAILYHAAGLPTGFMSYPFDHLNRMWGGKDSLLVCITDTSIQTYLIPYYQSPSYVQNLCIDDSDHIWSLMSIYDASNTTQNSSLWLVKFDGVNWSRYRIIDYDTSGVFINEQAVPSNAPEEMYAANGKIYIINGYGTTGYFDGSYYTFLNYGLALSPDGLFLGRTTQNDIYIGTNLQLSNGRQVNIISAYDSNQTLLLRDTSSTSASLVSFQFGGGMQQIDGRGTYWYLNENDDYSNIIYYENPFLHLAGSFILPAYIGADGSTSGYFYMRSVNYNAVRNTLILNSTVNSFTLTNGRPNSRFMEINLDSFYAARSAQGLVWPGDANDDLLVDNSDLLSIGLAYAATGPVRSVQDIVWQADSAAGWTGTFSNSVNYKYADCNGDGIVNADDTLAIIQNFSLTHSKTNTQQPWYPGLAPIYVTLSADTVIAGDTLYMAVQLGDTIVQADSVYGVAFDINYDATVIDTTKTTMTFGNSWLGSATDKIGIAIDKPVLGVIKAAVTRIDHTTRSGLGPIATVTAIVTTDNIDGKDLQYYKFRCSISNVTAIDNYGNAIQLNEGADSNEVAFTPLGIVSVDDLTNALSVYPNPAKNYVNVSCNIAKINNVEIIDVLGKTVSQTMYADHKKMHMVNTQGLSSGVYTVVVKTEAGSATRKLIISE